MGHIVKSNILEAANTPLKLLKIVIGEKSTNFTLAQHFDVGFAACAAINKTKLTGLLDLQVVQFRRNVMKFSLMFVINYLLNLLLSYNLSLLAIYIGRNIKKSN